MLDYSSNNSWKQSLKSSMLCLGLNAVFPQTMASLSSSIHSNALFSGTEIAVVLISVVYIMQHFDEEKHYFSQE